MGILGAKKWIKTFVSENDFSSQYFFVLLQYNTHIATICG